MRQFIFGLVAAAAVVTVTAAPASACGGRGFISSCSPCGGYVSSCGGGYGYHGGYTRSSYGYNGYGYGGGSGYGYAQLPSPQYYYANQGPVYGGPAAYAPAPSYQQDYGYTGGPYANAMTHYSAARYQSGPAIYSYRSRPAFHTAYRRHHGHGHSYHQRPLRRLY